MDPDGDGHSESEDGEIDTQCTEEKLCEAREEMAHAMDECVAVEETVENCGILTEGKARRLAMLEHVRLRISEHLKEIGLEFPLKECNHANYMGFCNSNSGHWVELSAERKMAKITKVNWISIRLCKEGSDEFLPISSIIATLLHELAHAITPTYLVRGVVMEYAKAKSSRKWRYEHHGADFYRNFARILEVAEELKIFVLSGVNKFSARSLARFDAIDLGSACLPAAATPFLDGLDSGLEDRKKSDQPLRITVKMDRGKMIASKLVIVTLEDGDDVVKKVLEEAKRKHNCKGGVYTLIDPLQRTSVIQGQQIVHDSELFLVKSKAGK